MWWAICIPSKIPRYFMLPNFWKYWKNTVKCSMLNIRYSCLTLLLHVVFFCLTNDCTVHFLLSHEICGWDLNKSKGCDCFGWGNGGLQKGNAIAGGDGGVAVIYHRAFYFLALLGESRAMTLCLVCFDSMKELRR